MFMHKLRPAPIVVAGRPNPGPPMKVRRREPPAGRRAAVGARRGPGGPVGTPWRAQGSDEHQPCTNTGQSSDPSDDYMLRAALEGTHFFLAENRHAPQNELFLVLL